MNEKRISSPILEFKYTISSPFHPRVTPPCVQGGAVAFPKNFSFLQLFFTLTPPKFFVWLIFINILLN